MTNDDRILFNQIYECFITMDIIEPSQFLIRIVKGIEKRLKRNEITNTWKSLGIEI